MDEDRLELAHNQVARPCILQQWQERGCDCMSLYWDHREEGEVAAVEEHRLHKSGALGILAGFDTHEGPLV